jgi:hypothetical protein
MVNLDIIFLLCFYDKQKRCKNGWKWKRVNKRGVKMEGGSEGGE